MSKRDLSWRLLAAAVLFVCGAAQAQTYPSKPVTIFYTTPPGASLDVISRVLAVQFEKRWGQPVIVESRSGGGGAVASGLVARAPADGYLLLVGGSPLSNTLFVKDSSFDAFKDITGVSLLGILPYHLDVSRGMNVRTLKEFIAHAKANPGKVTIGVVAASSSELWVLGMLHALGVTGNVIGYKGIAPMWLAMAGNQLDATISASAAPQLKSGEIVAIAMGGEKRHPALPDLPTFREQGAVFDPMATYFLSARGGTPRAVLDRISAEAAVAVKSQEFESRVTKSLNIVGAGLGVDATNQFLRDEYAMFKKIADIANIQPQ